MKEGNKKDAVLLTVIGIATLLVAIVGATFAYFTARITNNDNTSALTIHSSSGGTSVFAGGDTIVMDNIYPREAAWVTKPIKISYNNSTSQYPYKYKLYLNYNNDFNTGQIAYSLTVPTGYCSTGLYATEAECIATNGQTWETISGGTINTALTTNSQASSGTLTKVGNTTTRIYLGEGTFAAGANNLVHAYVLTISYPDSGINQNYTEGTGNNETTLTESDANTNQGKTLSAWVSIEESTQG